ncbi:hypothetical protein KW787_01660 [Candidatus Pacearchaeota archaeon]|nr:hypothetical protein [Candidatus Pacearchaeota archaeon]
MKIIGVLLIVFIAISLIASVNAIEVSITARATDGGSTSSSNVSINTDSRNREERIEQGFLRQKSMEGAHEFMEKNRRMMIDGRNITIHNLTPEQSAIIAGRINAKTGLNLTAEDINDGTLGSILSAYLSNGRKAMIKVMPDRASATALKRLRTKCSNDNCTIELKEVGVGNKTRVAYMIETEKDSNLFFIFNKKMFVAADVDAETGEVIAVHKPWWSLFAKEKNDSDDDIDSQVEADANASVTG